MKKNIIAILLLILVFSVSNLVACGLTSGTDDNTSDAKDLSEWLLSEDAKDYNEDGKTDAADYNIYIEYKKWQASEDAFDYTGDRKINYDDYEYYTQYKEWKLSSAATDYNGDAKINLTDYEFYLKNGGSFSCAEWLNSEFAFDADGNGVVDTEDYAVYSTYAEFVGNFKIVDFAYSGCDFYINESSLSFSNMGQALSETEFTFTARGKLLCSYSENAETILGNDKEYVDRTMSTCRFERISPFVAVVTFYLEDELITFSAYLTGEKGNYESSFHVSIRGDSSNVSLKLIYD